MSGGGDSRIGRSLPQREVVVARNRWRVSELVFMKEQGERPWSDIEDQGNITCFWAQYHKGWGRKKVSSSAEVFRGSGMLSGELYFIQSSCLSAGLSASNSSDFGFLISWECPSSAILPPRASLYALVSVFLPTCSWASLRSQKRRIECKGQ